MLYGLEKSVTETPHHGSGCSAAHALDRVPLKFFHDVEIMVKLSPRDLKTSNAKDGVHHWQYPKAIKD